MGEVRAHDLSLPRLPRGGQGRKLPDPRDQRPVQPGPHKGFRRDADGGDDPGDAGWAPSYEADEPAYVKMICPPAAMA